MEENENKEATTYSIAIGRGAVASPTEFVLNVELGEEVGEYTTLRTLINPTEYFVIRTVLERAVSESLPKPEETE